MEALFAEIAAKSQPAVTPQSEAEKAGDTEDDVASPDETPPATEH